jgi:hypothetical protein
MTAIPIAAGTRQAASMTAATTAVAVRLLRKYVRSPQMLVWGVAGGAIFIVLFRYIFGGSIRFGSTPYVDFLMPGMILTSVLVNGAGTAVGVAEDRDQGFFDRLRSLPMPRSALLAGRVLGDTVIVAWGTAITTAMGFLVGSRTRRRVRRRDHAPRRKAAPGLRLRLHRRPDRPYRRHRRPRALAPARPRDSPRLRDPQRARSLMRAARPSRCPRSASRSPP